MTMRLIIQIDHPTKCYRRSNPSVTNTIDVLHIRGSRPPYRSAPVSSRRPSLALALPNCSPPSLLSTKQMLMYASVSRNAGIQRDTSSGSIPL